MEDALNNLSTLFPSVDKVFLEDVYVSSKKDFDKTVDQLLSMGIEMEVGKREEKKLTQQTPQPIPAIATPTRPSYAIPASHPPAAQYQPPPNKPQQNTLPPMNPAYSTPGSPLVPQKTNSPQLPPPLTPNVPPPQHHQQLAPQQLAPQQLAPPSHNPTPSLTPTPGEPTNSYSRNLPNMFSPATPPPIISSTPTSVTSPTPTAPPATPLASSHLNDQKRMETMKQELALEYQRLSEKSKYNLELQQKLEQLSEFTTSEQKKLEEQRTLFAEEKRRFTEELTARFKALEEDFQRQREELDQQEQSRVQAHREREEAKAREKEEKRRIKEIQKEEEERARRDAELEKNEQIALLTSRLQEAQSNLESVLQEKNQQIESMRENSEAEIEALKERIKQLERQLKTAEYDTSAEVLSYFSTVVSTLASGIHAVSLARANNSENGEVSENAEPLRELKRTFFQTVNGQLTHKLSELD